MLILPLLTPCVLELKKTKLLTPNDHGFLSVRIYNLVFLSLYFRYCNPVPLADHNHSDHLTHMKLPDGTYLASDFNYTLPTHRKGYDTVGYKSQSGNSRNQWHHRFSTDARNNRGNDKGYYSDHTYESPISGLGQMANPGSLGYQQVNTDVNGTDSNTQLRQSNNTDNNDHLCTNTLPGTLTFPRIDKTDRFNVDNATLRHNTGI